jgi:hypothetical protein
MLLEEIDLFALRLTLSMRAKTRERIARWLEIWIKSGSAFIPRPGRVLRANTLVIPADAKCRPRLIFYSCTDKCWWKATPSPSGRLYAAGGHRTRSPGASSGPPRRLTR